MSQSSDIAGRQLLAYLAGFLLAPFVKSGPLSGRWVPLGQCVVAAQVAYETGALLGYRFRNQMPVFVKLFCEPGREVDSLNYLKQIAQKEPMSCRGERTTFFDLRWNKHVTRTVDAMHRAGRTQLSDPHDFYRIAQERV